MSVLPDLLAWLASGGSLDETDAAHYHDALALLLDALRHVNREMDIVLTDPELTPATRARLELVQAVLAGARRGTP